MKSFTWSLLFATVLFALGGCAGSSPSSAKESESLAVTLDVQGAQEAALIIHNATAKPIELTMSSGQQFDYQLLDGKKKVVHSYSADKLFAQAVQTKVLAAGKKWKLPLSLQSELAAVPAGSYTLVAWPTASELKGKKLTAPLKWKGASKATSAPSAQAPATQTLTAAFSGLQDEQSIAVETESGEPEVFRISEADLPFFEKLEEGAKLRIEYVKEGEQNALRSASAAE